MTPSSIFVPTPLFCPGLSRRIGVCAGAYGIDLYSRHEDFTEEFITVYWNVASRIAQTRKESDFFTESFIILNDHQACLNNAGKVIDHEFYTSRMSMDKYIEEDVYKDCSEIHESVKDNREIMRTPYVFTVHGYRKEVGKSGHILLGCQRTLNKNDLSFSLFSD